MAESFEDQKSNTEALLNAWKNAVAQVDKGALNREAVALEKKDLAQSMSAPALKEMTEKAGIPTGAQATRIDRVNALQSAGHLVPRYAELGAAQPLSPEAQERIATLTQTVAELQQQVAELAAAKPAERPEPAPAVPPPAPSEEKVPVRKPFLGAHRSKIDGMRPQDKIAARTADTSAPPPSVVPEVAAEAPKQPEKDALHVEVELAEVDEELKQLEWKIGTLSQKLADPTLDPVEGGRLQEERDRLLVRKKTLQNQINGHAKTGVSTKPSVVPQASPAPQPPSVPARPEVAPAPALTPELLAAGRRALDNLRHDGATMINENSLFGMLAKNGRPLVSNTERLAILADFEKQGLVGPLDIQSGWRAILGIPAAEKPGAKESIAEKFVEAAGMTGAKLEKFLGVNTKTGNIQPEPQPVPLVTPQTPLASELAAAPVPHKGEEAITPHLGEVVVGNDQKTDERLAEAWEKQAQKTEEPEPRPKDIAAIAERPGWTAAPLEERMQKAQAAMAARAKAFEMEGQKRLLMPRVWKAARRIGLAALILGGLSTATQNDHRPSPTASISNPLTSSGVSSHSAKPATVPEAGSMRATIQKIQNGSPATSASPELQQAAPEAAVPMPPQAAEVLETGGAVHSAAQEAQKAAVNAIGGERLGYEFPASMEIEKAGQTVWGTCVEWAKNVADVANDPSGQMVLGDAMSKIIVERNPTMNFKELPAGTDIDTSFLNSPEVERQLVEALRHWKSLPDQQKAKVFANYLKANSN